MRKFLVIWLICSLWVAAAHDAHARSDCYLKFDQSISRDSAEAVITKYGGRVIHTFPNNEFILEMHTDLYERLRRDHTTEGHRGTPSVSQDSTMADGDIGALCWNELLNLRAEARAMDGL